MKIIRHLLLTLLAVFSAPAFVQAQTPASSGTLLRYDFDDGAHWPVTSQNPSQPGVAYGKFGTVDVSGSTERSGGLALIMDCGPQPGWKYDKGGFVGPSETAGKEPLAALTWNAQIASGPLAVVNSEGNLGKLTLSFSLAASRALPITVIVESFDEKRERTGGLETRIFPAAADFEQRYSLDLSRLKPVGLGLFNPKATFVGFTIQTGSAEGWPAATHHEVRLDNIHYAKGAYYVSATGNDAHDGRTEQTAFSTPQRAIEAAQPGDVILVMNGTYSRAAGQPAKTPVARFIRPGTPSAWITLKNYPGHSPVLSSHGQKAIEMTQPDKVSLEIPGVLSYLEVCGLCVRGNGDTAREKYPVELGTSSLNTDSQGIVINGRTGPDSRPRLPTDLVHHIRLADNLVEFCTADGIYVEFCDWLFVENNRIENLYWGGAHSNASGVNDLKADPLFVSANDFSLRPISPAVTAGRWETFTPIVDLEGNPRPLNASPSAGAFQLTSSAAAAAGSAQSKPFGGKPWPIPGLIQAENFDEGPEGVAFHETDPLKGNLIARPYRNSPVDIEDSKAGAFLIGVIKNGEWWSYTVDVKKTGSYDIDVSLARWNKPGSVHLEFNGVDKTGPIEAELTKKWDVFSNVRKSAVTLETGVQVMKVVAHGGDEIINLDSIRISPAGTLPVNTVAAAKPTFGEWYYAGSLIAGKETTPANAIHGVTSGMTEHLCLANLSANDATAVITYYFEDDAPFQRSRKVPAHGTTIYRHHNFKEENFPVRKLFGAKITTDQPTLVQITRGGTESVQAPLHPSNFESSVIAYQGPLGKKETKWTYADGHPIVTSNPRQWSDWEYITILNPNPDKPANVQITFHFIADITTPKVHTLTVPAERLRNVALHELPMLPALNGNQGFYPVVESDVPVIVEQTRRPVVNENPAPRGGWHLMALPIGDVELKN